MITFVSPSVDYAGAWPPPWPSPTFPYLWRWEAYRRLEEGYMSTALPEVAAARDIAETLDRLGFA